MICLNTPDEFLTDVLEEKEAGVLPWEGGGLYSSTPSPTGEHPQATLESGQTQLHVKSLTTVEINILQEEQ